MVLNSGYFMLNIADNLNAYFIEMIVDQDAKEALTDRLYMTVEDRNITPMPVTKNLRDALYVNLGCKFQDNALRSVLLALMFIVMMGLIAANLIMSVFH